LRATRENTASRTAETAESAKAESQRPFLGTRILRSKEGGSVYAERANELLTDLRQLEREGIRAFSPFLEIGAGSGQRSAALLNHYRAEGIATDISQTALLNMPFVLVLLDYERCPVLICCDACHLPFLADTFQFVFAYRTLHHFQDPVPVVAECYRVLGRGGAFFFSQEPMDSPLRRLLRGNRTLSRPPTRAQRLAYRVRLQSVFWYDGALERSLGMFEGLFDMAVWRQALQPFAKIDIEVSRRLKIRTDLHKPWLRTLLAGQIAGEVRGVCRKTTGEPAGGDPQGRLVCLDCGSIELRRGDGQLRCGGCGRGYPITAGVLRMLPRHLEEQLYTEGSAAGPACEAHGG
jgi:SAM-dependent methyltransferase